MTDSDGMETQERISSFHIYLMLCISLLFNPSLFFFPRLYDLPGSAE